MKEFVRLGNEVEYMIFDNEQIDGVLYTMFVNVEDNTDICFRKTIIEGNDKYFIGLDDEAEFNKVLERFMNKINR